MFDSQQRRLDFLRARSAQQRDQQLDGRPVNSCGVLHGERPEFASDRRDDSLVREALRGRLRARAQGLGAEHAERREQPRGIDVATRLDCVKDCRSHLLRHLELLKRYQQGRGELLQIGRLVKRCRVIEHRQKRRNHLLVQELCLKFANSRHCASVITRAAGSLALQRSLGRRGVGHNPSS